MSTRNSDGYPVPDKLAQAHAYAEAARERLAAAPCGCRACVAASNLAGVQRILARYTPMDKALARS